MSIKLIVLDCDGVLSVGETQPFNLKLFARLADLNRRARHDKSVPAVTLNTGRPAPYVEAVMQAIEGRQPALYENGSGMYLPQTYRFQANPLLTMAHKAALQEIIQQLDREVVQPGLAYWQPGKSVCYSLFAHAPHTIADIFAPVEAIVKAVSAEFVAVPAVLALNIYPAAINKGSGLRWLADTTGIDFEEMAGVGDSAGDVDFLQWVGHPAAPLNATDDVKEVVHFVAHRNDALGLLDILDYWGTLGELNE